ncbi:MAG: hypothetical protein ABIJ19_01765 [Patescibacteria group bacterium]
MSKIQINWSKLIPLKKEEIEKIVASGGVYRISKKADDGKYYVFFIGHDENIKEKLLLHLSEEETNLRLKAFLKLGGDFKFRYAIVKEKNTQEAIEKQMYKIYLPEYNLEEPKSLLDIEANLN